MSTIFNKILNSYKNNTSFVVYRKPNKNTISGFFLSDDSLYYTKNFDEKGFVFAPFDANDKAILFPLEKSEFLSEKQENTNFKNDKKEFIIDENAKKEHITIVEKAILEIKNSDIEKIVISRKETVQLTNFDVVKTYQKLLQNYKNAFVYVWFHPKVGLWLGATPETLLQTENAVFKTMSLAGTQLFTNDENVVWKSKELEEQQLVTDFIKNQLKDVSSTLKIDKTETVKAGNLLHLKTKVEGKLQEKSSLKILIRALHPTPAVCGLPRVEAKNFILKNENYHRSFYTGFLGEINIDNKSKEFQKTALFVNLRCMEIENNTASIYIGGGITKDSIAKNEWQETVSKSETMKKVL